MNYTRGMIIFVDELLLHFIQIKQTGLPSSFYQLFLIAMRSCGAFLSKKIINGRCHDGSQYVWLYDKGFRPE